jgi:hypothetical protein
MSTLQEPFAGLRNALARTVDLVNTVEAADGLPRDRLASVLVRHGEVIDDRFDSREAARCQSVIGRLGAVTRIDDVDQAAAALNVLLARWCSPPRLVRHEGWPWHLHLDRRDDDTWNRWIGASGAFALAASLSGRTTVPWGRCAASDCDRAFVHDDRGGVRRFCSPRCASRTRVRRHRELLPVRTRDVSPGRPSSRSREDERGGRP